MGVGFDEFRSYVLLRNSGMPAEDKKRLVVDSKGTLQYDEIVKSLKLLGSKFFHELQGGAKSGLRTKVYDVNAIFDDEVANVQTEEEPYTWNGEFSEDIEGWFDESDPDYILVAQFEDGLVEALQSDTELANCLSVESDLVQQYHLHVQGAVLCRHGGADGPHRGGQ